MTDWWFSLIFFTSGTSQLGSGGDFSGIDRFRSLTGSSTLCAEGSSFSVTAGVLCAALVVVQELPLLILRIIRGESQPELPVVISGGCCCSLSSVDGSCGGGDGVFGSELVFCFCVNFGVESVSEESDETVLMVNFGIMHGSGSFSVTFGVELVSEVFDEMVLMVNFGIMHGSGSTRFAFGAALDSESSDETVLMVNFGIMHGSGSSRSMLIVTGSSNSSSVTSTTSSSGGGVVSLGTSFGCGGMGLMFSFFTTGMEGD